MRVNDCRLRGKGLLITKRKKNLSFVIAPVRGESVELPALIDVKGEQAWKRSICSRESPVVLDLFCGAGGMSLGFETAGYHVGAAVDIDPWSCKTHAANLLSKSLNLDLTSIGKPRDLLKALYLPSVDIIIGGPPCQGFSRVGKGKIKSLIRNGTLPWKRDPRNRLCLEFVRFVKSLMPLAFVMENVPDIQLYRRGEFVHDLTGIFEDLGYQVYSGVLSAADFGVPQRRQRFFMIGIQTGKEFIWPKPSTRKEVTLRTAISDLPPAVCDGSNGIVEYCSIPSTEFQRYARKNMIGSMAEVIFDHVTRSVRSDDRIIFRLLKPGDKYLHVPSELRRYRSDIFRDKYTKLRWDEPSWTITAHLAKDGYRYIHPDGRQARTISVREAARLQSFPDNYRFTGYRTNRYRQIGNAVPPLLARVVAEALLKAI
jgi:DNA (cytosine-5)-methyltransferase 1